MRQDEDKEKKKKEKDVERKKYRHMKQRNKELKQQETQRQNCEPTKMSRCNKPQIKDVEFEFLYIVVDCKYQFSFEEYLLETHFVLKYLILNMLYKVVKYLKKKNEATLLVCDIRILSRNYKTECK